MIKNREMGWADVIYKYRLPIVFALTFICMLLMSFSSFLHECSVKGDINCFISCAKYMWDGKVLYRDFFDHKGPVLYFLHYIGYLFPNPYHGMFLIEVASVWIFLFYADKTVRLLLGEKSSVILSVLIAVSIERCVLILSGSFGQTEGYVMPIIMYAIYIMVKYVVAFEKISIRQWFLLGLFSGLIFWSKYTILLYAVPIVFVLAYHLIKTRQWDSVRVMVLYGLFGFVSSSVCIILYFIVNHALSDLVDVYFVSNIFGYSDDVMFLAEENHSMVHNILTVLLNQCNLWFVFISFVVLRIKDDIVKYVTLCYLVSAIVLCLFKFTIDYYTLPLVCWHPLLFILFYRSRNEMHRFKKSVLNICYAGIVCLLAYIYIQDCINVSAVEKKREEWVSIIKVSDNQNVCVLNGTDIGFYYLLNNYPDRYYFSTIVNRHEEIVKSWIPDIESGKIHWVIISEDKFNVDLVNEVKKDTQKIDEFTTNGFLLGLYRTDI